MSAAQNEQRYSCSGLGGPEAGARNSLAEVGHTAARPLDRAILPGVGRLPHSLGRELKEKIAARLAAEGTGAEKCAQDPEVRIHQSKPSEPELLRSFRCLDIPKTEQLAKTVPGFSQGDAAPKSLGSPEDKELMRKPSAPHFYGRQADRDIAGNTLDECYECKRLGWKNNQPRYGVSGLTLCWTHASLAGRTISVTPRRNSGPSKKASGTPLATLLWIGGTLWA